ncbi:hypothetical protein FEM03_21625 [Phragmitibacter flavus]|uniref:FecR protein domain-containing protein n=1 Tax=Phragmitibacter flavus TaxID=2576071 RepID=A0A5R8K8K6_9BACT|nr:FecR domain-containing protein [Phragmitibacter flavus]TLD68643.1 hypothetical protein FEM03_21625 [Phragmitibacter flavus]
MKPTGILPILALAIVASTLPLGAADYDTAEITRLHNKVSVVKSDDVVRNANVGETIDRISSVTTGEASRAELRFPDKSLTRLGANSRFTLRAGARTIDLDQGVMLLQVPKKIGGAKVRTAAVTAAVTGTTVLFEYLPDGFIKLIVIEGEVDLFFNNDPSKFRTVKAGEMIVMQTDSDTIPEPVDIDLARLLKTSKLISGDEEWMPNHQQVADAVKDQQKKLKNGELAGTRLYLPGRGTQIAIESNTYIDVLKSVPTLPPGTEPDTPNTPPEPTVPGGGTPGDEIPGGGGSSVGLITGTSVLNSSANIRTNPQITAFNSITGNALVSQGTTYNGEQPFPNFAFDTATPLDLNPADPRVDTYLSSKPWAVFKFEDLIINGSPNFEIVETPNVILSAVGDVSVNNDSFIGDGRDAEEYGLQLYYSDLQNLTLYSQNGNVNIGPETFINFEGTTSLALIAASPTSDININADIYLGPGEGESESEGSSFRVADDEFGSANLLLSAGRDININTPDSEYYYSPWIRADNIDAQAGRDINVDADVGSRGNLRLTARRNINISSSGVLRAFAENPDALLKLETLEGDITINGGYESTSIDTNTAAELIAQQGSININNSSIYSDSLKVQVLGTNGWINIGNSHLNAEQVMKLYAEGSNGGVSFSGNVSLDSAKIDIAGKTVRIEQFGEVYLVRGPNGVTVFTDDAQFRSSTRENGLGTFTSGPNGAPVDVSERRFNERN